MHTEEQAKEVRCCGPAGCGELRRVDLAGDGQPTKFVHFCIASQCMAWRWIYGIKPNPDGAASLEKPFVPAHEQGYCGLAGRLG